MLDYSLDGLPLKKQLGRETEMHDKTTAVAERFVDLVLSRNDWSQIVKLTYGDFKVFFSIVAAAGFNPKKITPGKLTGRYIDQDGCSTDRTYVVNSLCQFKVVSQDGSDNYFATGWLDCALRRVVQGARMLNEGRDSLVGAIAEEIKRSVPLEPIQLTLEGDMLRECSPGRVWFGFEYFVDHTRDGDKLTDRIGVHALCEGIMYRRMDSGDHDVIACSTCGLRVPFPYKISTYGELRKFMPVEGVQASA